MHAVGTMAFLCLRPEAVTLANLRQLSENSGQMPKGHCVRHGGGRGRKRVDCFNFAGLDGSANSSIYNCLHFASLRS